MPIKKKKHRYRVVNGKSAIEVRIRSVAQLFDARDPAPFRERDLDDDFVEYVTASAEELRSQKNFKVIIHIEDTPKENLDEKSLVEAIRDYFEYQVDLKSKQLSKILKTGQMFLVVGLVFLFVCLIISNLVSNMVFFQNPTYTVFLREGFVIIGWVAMWKPLELILFDWWPVYDKMRLYREIIKAEIDIYPKPADKIQT